MFVFFGPMLLALSFCLFVRLWPERLEEKPGVRFFSGVGSGKKRTAGQKKRTPDFTLAFLSARPAIIWQPGGVALVSLGGCGGRQHAPARQLYRRKMGRLGWRGVERLRGGDALAEPPTPVEKRPTRTARQPRLAGGPGSGAAEGQGRWGGLQPNLPCNDAGRMVDIWNKLRHN